MEPIREAEMQTQPGKRLNEESKKNGKVWKIVVGVVAAAVVVFFGACCILAHASTAFFPHTAINGVDVSGLTLQEAQSRLETVLPQRVCKIYLSEQNTVSPEEREPAASITFAELGISPEAGYDGTTKSAYILQHGKGYCSTGFTYLKSLLGKNTGYNSSLYWDSRQLDQAIARLSAVLNSKPLDMAFQVGDHSLQLTIAKDGRSVADNELRRSIQNVVQVSSEPEAIVDLPAEILPAKALTAQQLYDQLHGEVRNASYDSATDSIVPEQLGADFDIAAVQKAMDEAAPGETLTVPADIQQPEVTAADLKAVLFRDVLGEAKTHVSGSAGRIGNVKLSAQIINGLVLNSGETFSYNDTLGERTAEKGYKPAPAYVKGETVDEVGGGICQTTTTLYNAVIRAELTVVSRKSHSMIVSYVEPALDATVDYKSGLDFTFTNTLNYPIYIESYVDGDSVTVNIWGVEERAANRTIAFTSTRTTDFVWKDPLYVQRVDDVNCKVRNINVVYKQKTLTDPHPGFTAQSYKHVYIDGVEQSVELLNTSVYGPASGELIHASDCTIQARPNEVPTGSSWATLPNIGIAFTIDTYTLSGEQWPYYPY